MELTDIHQIKALLGRHGFRFTKSLGQNFLCAGWAPERIAEAAELDKDTGVLEIGPGIGCLTAELSARAGRVLAVELDRSLMPVLGETLRGMENVEVLFGDILRQDLPALCGAYFSGCARTVVCANLPYQITTPALTALARSECFETITVMIQREVALRVCARENTPEYGAFTVLMQWHTAPEPLFDVPPGCFIPPPRVTSSVVRLRRREVPPAETKHPEKMMAIVRAAFQQRRKTLRNALEHGLGLERERIDAALSACGLDQRIRGEALSIARFAALSDRLYGDG